MIRRARGAGALPDGLDPELIQVMLSGALLHQILLEPVDQTEEQLRDYIVRTPNRPRATPKMSKSFPTRRGRRLRATALGIQFALELCILASLAALAAQLSVPALARVLLGVLFCVTGAAVWGAFLSPKRKYEIGLIGRLVLEALFFGAAASILIYVGWPVLAIALVAAAVDRIALALIP